MSKEVENIKVLNKDKLIEVLVYNVCTGYETADARHTIKTYYSLLSLEELQKKAEEKAPLYMPDMIQTSAVEVRRREIRAAKERKIYVSPPKTVHIKPVVGGRNMDWEMQTELFRRDWVKSVTILVPSILGVVLHDNTKRKIVDKIKNKLGYTGDIIYG